LRDFSYRTEIGIFHFVAGGALAFLIAALTVSYQSVKAALVSPADALRYE
jgi:putative ABC transport system permease protein